MNFALQDKVFPEIAAWFDELKKIRHEIHQTPELGFDTEKTAARIASLLSAWGIEEIHADWVKNGVIAVIEGSCPGETIALRADIDALPLKDCSGKEWHSTIENRSHSCGHDGHQTWLLGACRYLALKRDFPGRVVAIFQPCEEPTGGARAVIETGVFEKFRIREVYGAHTEPFLDKGTFGLVSGPLQASSDNYWIRLTGAGTHGGRPHLGIDPIPAGAELVSALQTIVSRKVDPIEPAVVSVCSINAGRFEAQNVIPKELTMSGTVRTYSEQVRDQIETVFREMVNDVARMNGCKAELKYLRQTAAVINDPEKTEELRKITSDLFGPDTVKNMKPFMSSEDFSEYQMKVPGVMIRIGIRDAEHTAALHSAEFDFNDDVLPAAATLFCTIAAKRLNALSVK